MLRLFLWRFTFEFLNFLKLLRIRGPVSHYFAFGANLDPAVILRRSVQILGARPATAHGYALRFIHEVPFRGVGMASMEPAPSESIRGVIYDIPKVDEWIMDCYEAVTVLRRHAKVRVTIDGVPCFCYRTRRPLEGLVPSVEYLSKIVAGYKKHFPEEVHFIRQLEATQAIAAPETVFPPRFLCRDYDRFGKFFRPLLEKYDGLCVRVFLKVIFRPSVFHRWLPR